MTTLYRKVGKRYEPVGDTYEYNWFEYGSHLIVSAPGRITKKHAIDPDFAAMIAACEYAKDAMAAALVDGSRGRPANVPLTDQQMEAWRQFQNAMGDEFNYIQYPSAAEAVQAGLTAMQEEASTMLEHPAVKNAWDAFMMIWKLSKNS